MTLSRPRGPLTTSAFSYIKYTLLVRQLGFVCVLLYIARSGLLQRLNSKIVSYCLTDISHIKHPDKVWSTSLTKMPMFTKAEMKEHITRSGKHIANKDHHSVPTSLRKAKTFLEDEYLHEIIAASD